MAGPEGARSAFDRIVIVHDDHPRSFAGLRDVRIEQRVVHAADDDFDGNTARGDVGAGQLPVSEMTGDEDDALPRRLRLENTLEPFTPLEQVEYALATELRQQCRLDDDLAEMTKGFARQHIDRAGILFGERRRDLPLDDLPPHAERRVRELAQSATDAPRCGERDRA